MQLGRPSPATNGQTPAQFLATLTDFSAPAIAPLGEFRAALAHLQTLPPENLQRLLAGTLDVCSHRLDAWISSFANARLAALRHDWPTGVRIGAYGWVENLKPAPAPQPVPTPAGESGAVQALRDHPGFIHAP